MTRIALLSSEAIRPKMAGIGIRYLDFGRRLAAEGLATVLMSPAAPEESAGLELGGVELRRAAPGGLVAEQLAGFDVAVAQGQIANDLVLAAPDLPVAIDLYDPWLIENLTYLKALGLDPYRNDHASWLLQMARGDFFLCSSEEQRIFYLGFLTAIGRVNPELVARDPDLRSLIDVVPFGVPDDLPPHRPCLPPRRQGEKRLLFGGVYDWYDPWTLLDALAALDRPDWMLLLIRNPNPGTPQRLLAQVERRCRRQGWWGSRVQAIDWVPAERRYDLLRDVDLLVAPHWPSLETRLSLRTRFLDALAAGCPVATSEGGAMSRLLREHGAGWVVPPGDAPALARALTEILDWRPGPALATSPELTASPRLAPLPDSAAAPLSAGWRQGAAALLAEFRWNRALAPLLQFCREPRREASKQRFVHPLTTSAPPDGVAFRLRRRLRRFAATLPGLAKRARPPATGGGEAPRR